MVVLDTDHISLLQEGDTPAARYLLRRVLSLSPDEVGTTIVTYEEQMRGWMAYVAKARGVSQQITAYAKLLRHAKHYSSIPILPFDDAAAVAWQELRQQRIRIGTMDLKIAAIAIANHCTLLTRNLRDFRLVPGIVAEDWTS